MRTHIGIILGLLWGTSVSWCLAAGACEVPPCGGVDPFGNGGFALERTDDGYALRLGHDRRTVTFDFGGWVESGLYTNGNGFGDNGPMHGSGTRRTDFLMDQLYLYGEKKMDAEHGLDWGGRVDLVYGVDAPGMQSYGDESFDSGWGMNDDGYGLSLYQLYATLGYKKWSFKYGKFATPVGWEASASKNNFFYSHSYCFWIEPTTHVGALADYALTDRLTLSAGWTAGHESGFENRYDDNAVLAGFTWKWTDRATLYYWMNAGHEQNDLNRGAWRFTDGSARNEYLIQSLCFEWLPTERFTYVMQYNLRNDNRIGRNGEGCIGRTSAYGINNHFLYKLDDRWSVGMRAEWLRDNGGGGYVVDEWADYWEITLGLNWNPCHNVSIRPEIRFDWADGAAVPYAEGTKKNQVSGGFGMLYVF